MNGRNIGPQSSTTPLGTPPQSSRPRLVAKSTSGLRDSLSKSGGNATKPGGGGPDPSQVWNRNRRKSFIDWEEGGENTDCINI